MTPPSAIEPRRARNEPAAAPISARADARRAVARANHPPIGAKSATLGARCCAAAAVILLGFGCSWWRYDDVLSSSPVEVLRAPSDMVAIGRSLAVMPKKSSTWAFATADNAFAIYEFDKTNLSSSDALDEGVCSPSRSCWLGESIATIVRNGSAEATACVAFGIESIEAEPNRVALYCADRKRRGLPLPVPPPAELSSLKANSKAPPLLFASSPRLAPNWLAAASSSSGRVWFYPTNVDQPVLVARPTAAGESFGKSLALAESATARFIVIGEPDAGNVYIAKTDGTTTPSDTFCIHDESGLAASVAAGRFTAESSVDLAILGAKSIFVIPALDSLPFTPGTDPVCVDLQEDPMLTNARALECNALNSGASCDGLLAHASIAAADLDGNGRDELLVGAPGASARGSDAAGKVVIVSFAKAKPAVVGELSASSAESGDRLGASIIGVPLSGSEVVLAGAPGGNKLAAFFCTDLLPEGKGGARCD